MVILNISEVLPAPIKDKVNENDIHLVTAQKYSSLYPESKHLFLLVIPFVSKIPSLFSKRLASFRSLRKAQYYSTHNHTIHIVALFMRGYRFSLVRPMLDWLSYQYIKKKLSRILLAQNVTIIHAHNVHYTAYIAYRLSKDFNIPYVITSRKIHSYGSSYQTKHLLLKSAAVISINHHHKRIVDQIIPTRKSYLLPHGIDAPLMHPISSHKNDTITKIVSVSNMIPRKNIDKILYALEEIEYAFTYDIYGDGPEMDHIKTIISHSKIQNKVNLKGRVEHKDVVRLLSSYDLFVLPSENETFGRVYIEAMSAGLPIIASKGTGIDGYIENGISGFLVDPKNKCELRETLTLLITDSTLRVKIGNQARLLSYDFYWDKIIDQLHAIYSSVFTSNGSNLRN